MKPIISNITIWLNGHVEAKQWVWFIVLWLCGLFTVVAITYPLKLLMKIAAGTA